MEIFNFKHTPMIDFKTKKMVVNTEIIKNDYGYTLTDFSDLNYIDDEGNIVLSGIKVVLMDSERKSMLILKEHKLLPTLYVVRSAKDNGFECGLDITENGYWVGMGGSVVHPTMETVIELLNKNIEGGFFLCLEEPLQLKSFN
jgi:hypothetical protein